MSTSGRHPRIAVVGAGIVGLATARALLLARPGATVIVIDKEQSVSAHQSGHNSGVIHSGVYYQPGSAKAVLCRRGRELLLDLCETQGIAHERCGKVVVAVEESERPALETIAARGRANGVAAAMVDREELRRLEPAVRGVAALRVDDAGIVDYVGVARHLAEWIQERGGELRLGQPVVGAAERPDEVVVRTSDSEITVDAMVSCAGLHSDRLFRTLTGQRPPVSIVPFRGEYHRLRPQARGLCRNLIYPVPDPRFPFLGVHLTRHVDGEVLAGPNAVLALRREGYTWTDASVRDIGEMAADPGLRRLAAAHWRTGLGEMWRSLHTRSFARALQRMTPDLLAEDLLPAAAGVRAQAIHPDGTLADDFVIRTSARGVHVLNAPSPAATASLAIGEELSQRVTDLLDAAG